MNESEARVNLENLIKIYLKKSPKQSTLLDIVKDTSRPGLPIRGILEEVRKYRDIEYSDKDKKIIDELLYLFG